MKKNHPAKQLSLCTVIHTFAKETYRGLPDKGEFPRYPAQVRRARVARSNVPAGNAPSSGFLTATGSW